MNVSVGGDSHLRDMTYAIMKSMGVWSAMRLNVRMNRLSSFSPGFLKVGETVRGGEVV